MVEVDVKEAFKLPDVGGTVDGVNIAARDHAESHTIASHSDTTATGAELETLTDNSMADTLHRHSELSASDGTPDAALVVDATGQVGIGTASPLVQFENAETGGATVNTILGDSTAAASDSVYFQGNSMTGGYNRDADNAGLLINNNGYQGGTTRFRDFQIRDGKQGVIAFFDGSTGRVGIGTESPATKLDVNGLVRTGNGYVINRTTLASIGGNPGDANSGELGAGWLNLARDDTSTVNQVAFWKNGSEVGSISTTGSATAYNTSSDYRLKENVVSMADSLLRISKLKPYRFNFKNDIDKKGKPTKTLDGFYAHEVQEIVPEAINGEKDGEKYQSIDHSKLVPLLVSAVQELKAEIDALKAKNKKVFDQLT